MRRLLAHRPLSATGDEYSCAQVLERQSGYSRNLGCMQTYQDNSRCPSAPLIEAIAQRTAQLVAELIKAGKPQPVEGRWGDIHQAAKHMGVKSGKALRERKQSGRLPPHLWRKFGGSVLWDLHAIDDYMANLPSE